MVNFESPPPPKKKSLDYEFFFSALTKQLAAQSLLNLVESASQFSSFHTKGYRKKDVEICQLKKDTYSCRFDLEATLIPCQVFLSFFCPFS